MMTQPLLQRVLFGTALLIVVVLLLFYHHPLNSGEIVTNVVRELQSAGASNDVCETAEPITIGARFFINSNSTPDTIANDCIDDVYYTANRIGVWYTFQGTGQRLFGRSCGSNFGDVLMSVFTGSCSNLQCVAGKLGLCGGAFFYFDTIAGITYHVLVQIPLQPLWEDYATIDAAPPPVINDACANAIPVAMDSKVSVNASYAAPDIRNAGCDDDGVVAREYAGVWYSFVGTGGRVVVRSCNSKNLIITLSIVEGSCDVTSSCVAATNDVCGTERFSLDTVQGTTYYVLLRADGFSTTEMTLDLSISKAVVSENDFCANAQPISIGSTVRANLLAATAEGDDVLSTCVRDARGTYTYPGVWYTLEGNGKRVEGRLISSCDRSDETSMVILSSGCNFESLSCVGGTKDLCRDRVLFPTEKGTTYHVIVKSNNPETIKSLKFTTCGLFRSGIFCPPTLREILREQFPCLFGGTCCGLFESC